MMDKRAPDLAAIRKVLADIYRRHRRKGPAGRIVARLLWAGQKAAEKVIRDGLTGQHHPTGA